MSLKRSLPSLNFHLTSDISKSSRALNLAAEIVHTTLGVDLKVDAYQYAIGGSDQDSVLILSLQIFRHLFESPTRADSGGTWLHQFFGGGVRVCDHRIQTQRAERHTPAIDHDTHVPTRSLDAVIDGVDAVIQMAGRRVRPRQISGAWDAGLLPFAGQAVGEPIRLAGGVTKDLSKPETFEPPCCARAQVALIIVAIDDHRLVAIKRRGRPAVQVFQRDADRAWQPLLLVLAGGQRFDELRADGRHRQHFFSIDLCRHVPFSENPC